MLSINTNLSSMIAQNSMKTSTAKLDQAIERMTTGAKLNHAKDNAANYSIATNMTTKMGALRVAEDNVLAGLDLVSSANDTISLMQNQANRLRSLSLQAKSCTYNNSLAAINQEAYAIMSEITYLYNTAQYDNKSLFVSAVNKIETVIVGTTGIDKATVVGTTSSPVSTYSDAEVLAMTSISDVSSFISGQKYSINSAKELEKLATLVNSNVSTSGAIFVLGADIDLSSISNWSPIGDYSINTNYQFKGIFDGNGHVIKNLTIDNKTKNYQGLFGRIQGAVIKNLRLENVNIKGDTYTAGLAGAIVTNSSIDNCCITGNINGTSAVGGLVGYVEVSTVTNSSASVSVNSTSGSTGGFIGHSNSGKINYCYATGVVESKDDVGGFVGKVTNGGSGGFITNSYSTVTVTATGNRVGGFVGMLNCPKVNDCYATGNVVGKSNVGGFVGEAYSSLIRCYATGNVTGTSYIGGLSGTARSAISNSYATGSVTGDSYLGGLSGYLNGAVNTCFAIGEVKGDSYIGGLIGQAYHSASITDSYTNSDVNGNNYIGALIGTNSSSNITNSYAMNKITGNSGSISINNSTDWDGTYFVYSYSSKEEKSSLESIHSSNDFVLIVGVNGQNSCLIGFSTKFDFDISAINGDISSDTALLAIDDFIKLLAEQATQLGAVENRLMSVLDEISTQYENLASSRSTIHDVDMAKVGSVYIKQQILQDASATLLSSTQNIQYQNVLGLLQSLSG